MNTGNFDHMSEEQRIKAAALKEYDFSSFDLSFFPWFASKTGYGDPDKIGRGYDLVRCIEDISDGKLAYRLIYNLGRLFENKIAFNLYQQSQAVTDNEKLQNFLREHQIDEEDFLYYIEKRPNLYLNPTAEQCIERHTRLFIEMAKPSSVLHIFKNLQFAAQLKGMENIVQPILNELFFTNLPFLISSTITTGNTDTLEELAYETAMEQEESKMWKKGQEILYTLENITGCAAEIEGYLSCEDIPTMPQWPKNLQPEEVEPLNAAFRSARQEIQERRTAITILKRTTSALTKQLSVEINQHRHKAVQTITSYLVQTMLAKIDATT